MKLEKKLIKLHELLCDELIDHLTNGEERPAPAVLNVIRQFLRDNAIDGTLDDNDALQTLVDELPEEFKKTFMQ